MGTTVLLRADPYSGDLESSASFLKVDGCGVSYSLITTLLGNDWRLTIGTLLMEDTAKLVTCGSYFVLSGDSQLC